MRSLTLLFCIMLFGLTSKAQHNVVLIIADDLSPDFFSFYEDYVDTVEVSNIRALLNKGVRFKNATSNPVCSSTRSGILTGRYSFRTGVGGIVGGIGGTNQLDTAEITIPRLLKAFNPNIHTANIGKWHLHQPNPMGNLLNPNHMGYDHFEGPFIGQLPSFTNWTKYTNGVSSAVTTYAATENVNNAVAWVKTLNPSDPFFLWLAFNSPHEPLHLPPAGLHSFTNLTGTAQDINTNPKSYFKAMIQAMDHEIGRLFDSLQVMNKLDSTDFIFIGDNGSSQRTAQIADLTRAKGTIYQYGIHIPMIISGPSVVNPDRSSDALVNTVDIFSSVLEMFGYNNWNAQIPANKPVDTQSLLPIIKNTSSSIRPWAFSEIFKLTTDSADGKTIRNTDYKLIRFNYGEEQFYNLTNDPLELNNLLNTNISATEIMNYNYLCSELTTLVGAGNYCNTNVGNNNIKDQNLEVFPNPFEKTIYLNNSVSNAYVTMYNAYGKVIYCGDNISGQDFSDLPKGIYFLKLSQKNQSSIKLVKH